MQLRPHQTQALQAMADNDLGQVIVPTGGGKTMCMIHDVIREIIEAPLGARMHTCVCNMLTRRTAMDISARNHPNYRSLVCAYVNSKYLPKRTKAALLTLAEQGLSALTLHRQASR